MFPRALTSLFFAYLQKNSHKEHAQRFLDKIGEADALIISFAEHNGAYTVAFLHGLAWNLLNIGIIGLLFLRQRRADQPGLTQAA